MKMPYTKKLIPEALFFQNTMIFYFSIYKVPHKGMEKNESFFMIFFLSFSSICVERIVQKKGFLMQQNDYLKK